MPSCDFLLLDVFTDQPLAGNQLAVFPDAAGIPEAWLQPLAREINFSETVFVYPSGQDGSARMRIFTPRAELPFAGHPILGTAVALARPGMDEILLETGKGIVPVRLEGVGDGKAYGCMSQPLPSVQPFGDHKALLAAIGVRSSQLPVEIYDNGVAHVYVALDSREAVAGLEPDLTVIARQFAGIGVNCFAGQGRHWKTRMFSPGLGVPEDPATGSAAGPLGVHLARHGLIAYGEQLEISQGVEIGRPSTLYARISGSAHRLERVEVGGWALVVGSAEFTFAQTR
ncbi:MAG: PhzF family phenazine biosynthesis protein [Egibacteraceae bacterium]